MAAAESPWWEIWRLLGALDGDTVHADVALDMAVRSTFPGASPVLADVCETHGTTPGDLRVDIVQAIHRVEWIATQLTHARRLVTDLPHPCRCGGPGHPEPCTCPCRECGGEAGVCECLPF